jgi:hypothetical protein
MAGVYSAPTPTLLELHDRELVRADLLRRRAGRPCQRKLLHPALEELLQAAILAGYGS